MLREKLFLTLLELPDPAAAISEIHPLGRKAPVFQSFAGKFVHH